MKESRSVLRDLPWFLPAALFLGALVLYPILRTIALSFLHESLAIGFRTEFAGFDNFRRVFTDSRFSASLWTTLLFTFVSVSAEFLIGLFLAIAVTTIDKWRTAVRVMLLVPWTLPTAVTAVLWAWILNDQYGALNALLLRAGAVHAPISWLGTPFTAMAAIVAADVWKTAPFVFVILFAGLQNIPQDLYDAIEIDGGGSWSKFRFVTWPHLLPFTFVALIFRIVQAFAIFDLVWVMTGGGPGGATETASIYTYRTYMRYLDFGYGAALVIITVAILSIAASGLYRVLVIKYEKSF
jgi:multiple sugar transport system permease protein